MPHYESLEALTEGVMYGDRLSPEHFRAVADAAHRVVVAEIHYTSSDVSIDNARRKRYANCVGLNFAMSALLQNAGVEHELGYGAGHAFLVAPTTGYDHFVDPIESTLTGPIALPALQIETAPRTRVATFRPANHVHPRFMAEAGLMGFYNPYEHHPWARVGNLVRVRLGEAEVGREALRQQQRFVTSVRAQRYSDAQKVVTTSGNLLPEVESDIRFNDCARAIGKQITRGQRVGLRQNESEQLAHLIDVYTSSLPDDGFLSQMRGDLMRALGKVTKRRHFLFRSQQAYIDGLSKRGGSYLTEKAAKVSKALEEKVAEE